MKKGKLTEVETCFIKNNPKLTAEELAKKLDRSEKVVNNYIQSVNQTEDSFIKKNIISKTEIKGQRVAVMTEAASSMIDASKKKKKKLPDYITKINDE